MYNLPVKDIINYNQRRIAMSKPYYGTLFGKKLSDAHKKFNKWKNSEEYRLIKERENKKIELSSSEEIDKLLFPDSEDDQDY